MANKTGWFRRLRAAVIRDPVVVGEFTNRDPNAANLLDMSRSDAGALVTATTAMQLDAVWACVRLIAESLAMLPLHLHRQDDKGPKKATRHPLYDLLRYAPNSKSTATVFWEAVVSAMLLQGNAYVLKRRNSATGAIASLVFMAPNRLNVLKDLAGNKQFFYLFDDGVQREVAAADVWQLQGYTLDGRDGVSVIEYGAQVFGSAIAAEKSAARTFINGMLQAVYYTVSAFLTDEQRDSFRKHVKGTVERGEAPILEGGVDVKALGIKPSDAQLLESRAYSVESICRWFRVPPSMVGHSERANGWGSSLEQQVLGYLTFTLTPWISRIEQAVSLGLLEPGDRVRYYAKFDIEPLLRADSKARSEYYQSMVNNGNMTRNEVRYREGLPLMGGNADILTVQGAMIALDSLTLTPQPTDAPDSGSIEAAMRAFLKTKPGEPTT